MAELAKHVWVSGAVQGVGFRYHTQATARTLGVRGWVRNLRDGRVEVWAEGESHAVEALVEWLAKGPAAAEVTECEVADVVATGAAAFQIRRDD
jgi:acylphosphatase